MKPTFFRAVTLIELVITFVIIGLISTVAFASLSSSSDFGAGVFSRSEAAAAASAIGNYRATEGQLPARSSQIERYYGTPLALVDAPTASSEVFISVDISSAADTAKVAKVDVDGGCWMLFVDYSPASGTPKTVYSFNPAPTECVASDAATARSSDGAGDSFLTPVILSS